MTHTPGPDTPAPATSGEAPAFRQFHSILYERPADRPSGGATDAECFHDLHLDRMLDTVTAAWRDYDLKPFFCSPLRTVAAIEYRQAVFHDLDNGSILETIRAFTQRLRAVRRYLAESQNRYYHHERQRYFLNAAAIYGDAVEQFAAELQQVNLASNGLLSFREALASYAAGDPFRLLRSETDAVKTALSTVRYALHIRDDNITVSREQFAVDYTAAIADLFAKFRQEPADDHRARYSDLLGMNSVEAQVLDKVARLYPQVFGELDRYCEKNRDFIPALIADFDREIHFYIAYREYRAGFEQAGLGFCYPRLSDSSKHIACRDVFDPVLADLLICNGAAVVCNDVCVGGDERILIVTGPNQGGKTTFARLFGQLHYLAALGCPVPGSAAQLFLCDQVFTHFERAETPATLRGKLQDELIRMRGILERATPRSVIVLNEMFASTSLSDATDLSKKILDKITQLEALCVCVTFLEELAALNEKTVSFVAAVDPRDPTRRTYRIERRPANGLAYALALAEKYRLSYRQLRSRLLP